MIRTKEQLLADFVGEGALARKMQNLIWSVFPGEGVTMTAGNILDFAVGYGDAAAVGEQVGSLSAQPVDGTTLLALYADNSQNTISIVFSGDMRDELAGKNLYVDGVMYVVPEWGFQDPTQTTVTDIDTPFKFVIEQDYQIGFA